MKRLALVSVSLLLIAASAASAGYSTTGSSGEVSTLEIFRNVYGGGMSGDNWCGTVYTDGTITATRVEDYADPYSKPGTPGDNLYLLSTSLPPSVTDQIWIDGVATVTARARYAGYQQQFGYNDGSGYTEILDVGDNTGFIDVSAGPIFFNPGLTWRWVREGSGLTWYSKEDDNSDDLDHLITYYVTGLNDGKITWVILWDDEAGGGDRDFNDFVLVITGQTIVPNIFNQTRPDANSAIIDVGLEVGTVTEQCDDTVEAGLVLSQDPNAGTVVPVGSAVNYVVSLGPCTRTLDVNSTAGGTVTEPGEDQFTYNYGTVVDINAEPETGYHFVEWTGDIDTVANRYAADTTITMYGNYSITANFAVNTYTLTVNNGTGSGTYDHNQTVPIAADAPPAGSHFVGWSGDTGNVADANSPSTTIVMLSDATITANYALNMYTLTVNNGTGSGTYDHNQTVPIAADAPPVGSHFVGWSGDTGNVADANSPSTTITMLSDATVTANYAVNTYTLTVNNGTGSGTYDHNQTVPIAADAPPAGSHFVGWSGDTGNVADANSPSTTIVMLSDATITANYALNMYTLTVNNGTGSGTYDHNQTVPIAADAPPVGSHFVGWSGDTGNVADANSPSTTIVMLSDATVTANYAVNTYTLTVNNGTGSGTYDHNQTVPIAADAPPAGSHFVGWSGDTGNVADANSPSTTIVMLSDATITANYALNMYTLTVNNGTGSGTYDHNQTVPIAADAPPVGSHFVGWSGDTGNVADANSPSTTIVMLSDATVTANYAVNTYTLTVNNGTGSGTYDHNQTVPIAADAPPVGSHFVGWSGDTGNVADANSPSTTITMLSDATITANYALNMYTLTVNNGTGSGTYDHNQTVPIAADAPPVGSHFVGWSGDTGNVADANSPSTTITMLSDATVTANYAVNTYTLTVNNGTGSGTYDHNQTVPIAADAPPVGSHFVGWSGDTGNVADANSPSTTIVMLSDATITANYALNMYTLTVNNGTGSGTYDHNQTVPIAADAPPVGSHFVGWSGDTGNVADANSPSTTITMLSDATITANYAINQYTVTVTSGSNGSVDPNGVVDVGHGESRTFCASPESCYEVNTWYLDGNDQDINETCYSLTNITGNHSVEVTFKQLQVIVPDVVGMTEAAAESALNAVGLVKGDVNYIYSATAEGHVLDQDPNAGISVPCGSEVDLVVSIIGVYVWTDESPYSMLWIDPLNWDPLGVPGEGDTAIINPPPWQGPVVLNDMSVSYIDGSRWTDGGSRWDIGDERFEKYGWDFDSDQVIMMLNAVMSIERWAIGGVGGGTVTVDMGAYGGGEWGEPNITIGELEGIDSGTTVFNIVSGSNVKITGRPRIIEQPDAIGQFYFQDNATVHLTGLDDGQSLRIADRGLGEFYISDDANVVLDYGFKGGDEDDGVFNLTMTGGSLSVGGKGVDDDEREFLIGDDGEGNIDIGGDAIFTVAGDLHLRCHNEDAYDILNLSDIAMVSCERLRLVGDDAEGEAEMNVSDNAVFEADVLWMAEGEGTATINMTGGHIIVYGDFQVPKSDEGTAEVYLHGGLIECGAFTHGNPGDAAYLLDICGDGVLVIDGNLEAEIWEDYDVGYITVCGYHQGCGSQHVLQVDYNNVNPGRTTVWVEHDPNRAHNPDPPCCGDDVPEVPQDVCLSWTPGQNPCEGQGDQQHLIFLSTNYAKLVTPGDLSALVAVLPAEQTTYCPEELALGKTYYWRVDEVCPCNTTRGEVWCFTVVSCMIVEDMESYDESCGANAIWEVWLDGAGDCNGIGGNGTGSSVYLAYEPVHGGEKSMQYLYDNTGSERECAWSEATKTFDPPLNLVDNFERAMVLWFYGDADNDTESMWVVLSDGTNEAQSTYGVYGDSPDDIKVEDWEIWAIDIAGQFPAVDLSNVESFSIGFGPRFTCGEHPGEPAGTVYFDDIMLCTTICVPKYAPASDINDDCIVDWKDFALISDNWLEDKR